MAFRSPAFASVFRRVLALSGFIGFLSSILCWIHSAQVARNSGVSNSSGNSVFGCALTIRGFFFSTPIFLLTSSLLFSGCAFVTEMSQTLRDISVTFVDFAVFSRTDRWRDVAPARFFADSPLCFENCGKTIPVSSNLNQPTFCIDSANPSLFKNRSTHLAVIAGAFPSIVCLSAQDHRRCNFPTTSSSLISIATDIPITAGSSEISTLIFIQSPAM